jgi:hypothetical protein
MVEEPSHIKQLSLNHVCKIGLSGRTGSRGARQRPSEGTLGEIHGLLSTRESGEDSNMTPPTEDLRAEAEAPTEAVVQTEDVERTEDAAAVRTRGGEAGQAEATTIESGNLLQPTPRTPEHKPQYILPHLIVSDYLIIFFDICLLFYTTKYTRRLMCCKYHCSSIH